MGGIHRLVVTETHEWALPLDPDVSLSLLRLPAEIDDVESISWTPHEFEMVADPAGKRERLLPADVPWYAGNVVMAKGSAQSSLLPVLGRYGKFFPLVWGGGELSIWICCRKEAVLDEAASQIRRFRDGRIMRIDKLALTHDPGGAFLLAEQPTGPLYFDDKMRDALLKLKLSGLQLVEVTTVA